MIGASNWHTMKENTNQRDFPTRTSASVHINAYEPPRTWGQSSDNFSITSKELSTGMQTSEEYVRNTSVININSRGNYLTDARQEHKTSRTIDTKNEGIEPTKKLSVAIPRDLHRLLKKLALDKDVTMGQLITDLLTTSLKEKQQLA